MFLIPSLQIIFEGPCLVQGWLEPGGGAVERVRSPSVQMFLDDKSVQMFDVTEQILSKASIHEGNVAPPPDMGNALRNEMLRQAGEAGRWLQSLGYRGTGSTLLNHLFDTGRLFRREHRTEGVVPINFNYNDEGLVRKGQFLFLGANREQCGELMRSIMDLSTVHFQYERD